MSARGAAATGSSVRVSTAGAAYIPALSDEVIMVRGNATIHLGGPSIVKVAINEEGHREEWARADAHHDLRRNGPHGRQRTGAIALLRSIAAKLNRQRRVYQRTQPVRPPLYAAEQIKGIVSKDFAQPYDCRELIARLVDEANSRINRSGAPAWCAGRRIFMATR